MSHLGIFGMTESGKSYHLKHELLPVWPCVIAYDVNDELSRFGRPRRARPLGELRERMTTSELRQYPSKLLEPNLSLAVVPDKEGASAEAAGFDLVARILLRGSKLERPHNVKLICCECAPYFRAMSTEQRERVMLLATRGVTHHQVDLVVESQRPNLVDATIRGNLDEVIYFKLPEALDVDTVRAKCGKEFALRVRQLPPRKFLIWRATGSTESAAPKPSQEQVANVETQSS